jgi:hypothetical protein
MRNKQNQCGGRVVYPAEYFGDASGRYGEDDSQGGKRAASFGAIHDDGTMGPRLKYKQAGGRKSHAKSPSFMNKIMAPFRKKHTKKAASKAKSKSKGKGKSRGKGKPKSLMRDMFF